jgi:anti-sigma B factor antagonist
MPTPPVAPRRAPNLGSAPCVSPALTVSATHAGEVVVCVATGEVDLATAGELRDAVLTAASGSPRARLDLSGLTFIDSTGLSALLELHSTLDAAGVRLQITAADGPVRQAVQITGLSHLLVAT